MCFELGCSVGMVLVEPVGSPLEDSIDMFLGLTLVNSFEKWELYLVVVSIGALGGLVVVTWKVYLFD